MNFLSGKYSVFVATAVLSAVLLAALFAGMQQLSAGQERIRAATHTGSWIASQAELEHVRLSAAVEGFFAGRRRRDDLMLRFDLFWSRIPLLVEGAEATYLRQIDGIEDTVASSLDTLARLERVLVAADPADAGARDRALALLEPLGAVLHRISIAASGQAQGGAPVGGSAALFETLVYAFGVALVAMTLLLGFWLNNIRYAHRQVQELARTRNELAGTAARLQQLLEHAPVSIALRDTGGRYIVANPVLLEWLRLPLDRVVGRSVEDVYPADAAAALRQADQTAIGERRPVTVERDILYPDGKTRSVVGTVFPIDDPDGVAIGLGSVIVDLTDLKAAEARLENAQRMEAVGQLTGGIAHDFNNLLTVVRGNLELLLDGAGPAETKKRLESAIRAVDTGAELTRRLLAFARRQTLSPKIVEIGKTLADVRALLDGSLREDIDLVIECEPAIPPVRLDRTQLETAIVNLAINAQDAMPEGGRLHIRAWYEEHRPGRGNVRVSVRDTGTGISADVLGRVYEPFFTTKEFGIGSGLGLSMVYGFVQQSEGSIAIDTGPGQGTTVHLRFPAAERGQTADGPAPAAAGAQGSRTVLLVEDSADVQALVSELLASLGHAAVTASSGAEALEKFDTERPRPDLLLTDVVLPGGISGLRIVEAVRAVNPGIPAILMSGYADAVTRTEGSLPEGVGFLEKPFSIERLAEALEDATRWRATGSRARAPLA